MNAVELQIQKARSLVLAGSVAQAEALLRQQLKRFAGDPMLHAELAQVLASLGQRDQALFFAEHAGTSRDMRALEGAAGALAILGEPDRAIAMFRRAITREPSQAAAHNGLGVQLINLRRLDEAREAFERAHALAPDDPNIAANVALARAETWSLEEALDLLRRERTRSPDLAVVQHQIPYLANYSDRLTPQEVLAEHRRFGELAARRVPPLTDPPFKRVGPEDADRVLSVGLMSADFREHSVSRFLEPILREHNPAAVRYTLYPVEPAQDETSARFRALAESWSQSAMLPEPRAAAAIRREGIDILIDLSGLTRGMRAGLLIARAAPLQINYLGYPNTTGMPNVDVRIVDSITDPPDGGAADRLATERLARLDPCFLCFAPPPAALDIPPRGPAGDGPVTFGSFNYLAKITPTTLDLWASILNQVPASRLLLKTTALSHAGVRDRLSRALTDLGIGAPRFELVPYVENLAEHYRLYHRVDVALDPFPYHGTTTTCEALYMGVPVITLAGDRHASRVGISLLTAAGAPELIAQTREDYIARATSLAAAPSRRTAYHAALRPQLLASPLGDAPAFARRFEGLLRTLWRQRVAQ